MKLATEKHGRAADCGYESFAREEGLGLRRRRFLTGLAALGASTFLPGCQSMEQTPVAAGGKLRRIDVHHHFVTPVYTAALKAHGIRQVPWTIQGSLEDMDKSGIATSITSLVPPSISFGDAPLGRKLARDANEYAAKLVSDYRGRFGSFASIPLPDTEGSLEEIRYALDTLKADGIGLMTSYRGKYLGDPVFWPVLEELDRRKAVVYTHPTPPLCCSKILPGLSVNTIEGPVDTTRTIASLLFGGAAARYPNIRWIFSHSGGVTPFLLSRFEREEAGMKDRQQKLPQGLMHELRKFYYETAQGHHPGALAALTKIAPLSQILYGTDYPFRPGAEVNAGLTQFGFSAADLRAIERENALRLLPRLKA
jgi:predicted TIM-barrel fold metal-dependent hydrolase